MSESDFSTPYRNVPFFGVWAEESADRFGKTAALDVLEAAFKCCYDEDVREDPDFIAAVAYLSKHLVRRALAHRFLSAFAIEDPDARSQAVRDRLDALKRGLGC
jgi:hypothetical protein